MTRAQAMASIGKIIRSTVTTQDSAGNALPAGSRFRLEAFQERRPVQFVVIPLINPTESRDWREEGLISLVTEEHRAAFPTATAKPPSPQKPRPKSRAASA